MGTVADKFSYLAGTKAAIKTAIEDKGVTVTEQDTFRSYATKIADIPSGGSSPAEWSWPDGWPDIQSIVENDTDNEYPYKCIFLLNNDCIDFDYSFGGNVEKVLTSDGITYTDDFIHTWDALQDVGEYRYLILYMSGDWTTQKDSRPISIAYNSAFMSGQTSLYSMFYGCESLQTIPLLDTSNVTNFSQMFYSCYSLQTIPLLDTSSGTDFGKMFGNCYSLQSIPELDTSSGIEFNEMFYYCQSLQTVPLLDTSSGTTFYTMFFSATSLQSIPLLDTSSGTGFNLMFYGCTSLQTIPLLDTSSGATFYRMFYGCEALQTVPLLDTSSGTNFGEMFSGCISLQTVPLLDTSSGTDFYAMFNDCTCLQTIPQLDTSNATNFSQMFYYCTSLQSMPMLDTRNVTNFSYTFRRCNNLQYIDASQPISHVYNFSVDFRDSNYLSRTSIINIFNNLPTTTGQTITIDTLADAKLSTVDKEIATNKGWTIAVS